MSKLISLIEQQKYIESKGWSTWYNPNNWVHQKTVVNSDCQDYTSYGMDLNSAYCFEKLNLPPFDPYSIPRLSQNIQGLENITRIQKLLKTLETSK